MHLLILTDLEYFPNILLFQDWGGFFNLTMTFREDSDIVMPYGRLVRREEGGGEGEEERRRRRVRGKTRLAAWFVSRCKTRSKREDLVQVQEQEQEKEQEQEQELHN